MSAALSDPHLHIGTLHALIVLADAHMTAGQIEAAQARIREARAAIDARDAAFYARYATVSADEE